MLDKGVVEVLCPVLQNCDWEDAGYLAEAARSLPCPIAPLSAAEASVVVDWGADTWKVGFAGWDEPGVLMKSPEGAIEGGRVVDLDSFAKGLRKSYSMLGVAPSERPLLMAVPPGLPSSMTSQLAHVAHSLGIPSVRLAVSAPLVLAMVSAVSGIVVDMGESHTTIAAVYNGAVVPNTVATSTGGGGRVVRCLASRFEELYHVPLKPEDAKAMLRIYGTVAPTTMALKDLMEQGHRGELPPALWRGPDGKQYDVAGVVLSGCEAIIDKAELGVGSLAHDALAGIFSSEFAKYPELVGHVVLCGGLADIRGVPERLRYELRPWPRVNIISGPAAHRSWIGASRLACLIDALRVAGRTRVLVASEVPPEGSRGSESELLANKLAELRRAHEVERLRAESKMDAIRAEIRAESAKRSASLVAAVEAARAGSLEELHRLVAELREEAERTRREQSERESMLLEAIDRQKATAHDTEELRQLVLVVTRQAEETRRQQAESEEKLLKALEVLKADREKKEESLCPPVEAPEGLEEPASPSPSPAMDAASTPHGAFELTDNTPEEVHGGDPSHHPLSASSVAPSHHSHPDQHRPFENPPPPLSSPHASHTSLHRTHEASPPLSPHPSSHHTHPSCPRPLTPQKPPEPPPRPHITTPSPPPPPTTPPSPPPPPVFPVARAPALTPPSPVPEEVVRHPLPRDTHPVERHDRSISPTRRPRAPGTWKIVAEEEVPLCPFPRNPSPPPTTPSVRGLEGVQAGQRVVVREQNGVKPGVVVGPYQGTNASLLGKGFLWVRMEDSGLTRLKEEAAIVPEASVTERRRRDDEEEDMKRVEQTTYRVKQIVDFIDGDLSPSAVARMRTLRRELRTEEQHNSTLLSDIPIRSPSHPLPPPSTATNSISSLSSATTSPPFSVAPKHPKHPDRAQRELPQEPSPTKPHSRRLDLTAPEEVWKALEAAVRECEQLHAQKVKAEQTALNLRMQLEACAPARDDVFTNLPNIRSDTSKHPGPLAPPVTPVLRSRVGGSPVKPLTPILHLS
eukprot:Sspe_Gene.19967::Locus_7302_Transcript_1_1_Confidence_1.000_Length_3228::g.19967::m.19967